ncbi:MAG: septum formation initiator family protein [Verrucomicrobiaceae bacterium]|nr:septum formation initiator family protein [Verrucomicrobiaceae bacterium]
MVNKRSRRIPDRLNRKQVGPDIWQRLTRLLAVLAVLFFCLLVFSYFVPEYEKLSSLDAHNDALQGRYEELSAIRQRKIEEKRRTVEDPYYLEAIARDRLNMQLPGEVIFRIDNLAGQ